MDDSQLFDYYPASGYDIKAAAEQTRGRVGAVRSVVAELEADHQRAFGAVEGTLEDSVRDAPSEAVARSSEVMREAEYAAGCLELFSVAIDDYNFNHTAPRAISKLNLDYSTAVSNAFGLDPLPQDATEEQVDEFSDGMVSASNAKIWELRREKQRLDGWLDDEAGDIRTMLDRGPNENDLQALWSAGVLPPYAPVLYPGTLFSAADMPLSAQEELKQYLIDNPDVLLDPPLRSAILILGLPTDVRTDIYVERRMEQLRREGLLTGPNPGGSYEQWIRNTVENELPIDTVIDIAGGHDITPDDFDVLDGLDEVTDPDGKSFFVLDTDMTGDAVRAAVLMTYILNAGTNYENGNFTPTPYDSTEVQRIKDRQIANSWSYNGHVAFVHDNGGRLVATPNGILMGAGGGELQDVFSQQAGSTYGDIFMIGRDDLEDPRNHLERDVIFLGTSDVHPDLDLDRLLHHEEIHSQQWADLGYGPFIAKYADERYDVVWIDIPGDINPFPVPIPITYNGCGNSLEEGAGLEDGGYQPCQ